ncbi:MAG TPA: cytochrome c3 family protein [Vicinamibacterales bacterium]|nr:cytochrome c3 family protein [Vicinamibacterales bacterium]
MADPRRLIALLVLLLASSVALQSQGSSTPQRSSPPGAVQPLPYSHKKHIALGLQCRTCHVNPAPGKLMTFPATAFCMGCHQAIAADRPAIQKLASFAASGTSIPWVRVYKLPDYVFWKHASHLRPDITCADCHGSVAERDVIAQETNITTMAGCVSCHDKRQVLTDCGDCHAPRQ